jgi:hypothetical protein
MKRQRGDAAYSRISVKSQTVLPKQVREALQIGPGGLTNADDPFAMFTEWAGSADDEAYGDL